VEAGGGGETEVAAGENGRYQADGSEEPRQNLGRRNGGKPSNGKIPGGRTQAESQAEVAAQARQQKPQ